jgi:hypothetical protein
MPMYYFHLHDNDIVKDLDGTELADTDAARVHAGVVARELKFKNDGFLDERWTAWSMHVLDGEGLELFSFPMSTANAADGK